MEWEWEGKHVLIRQKIGKLLRLHENTTAKIKMIKTKNGYYVTRDFFYS